MAIEIVDFPIKKWWFSIAMLNYQRVGACLEDHHIVAAWQPAKQVPSWDGGKHVPCGAAVDVWPRPREAVLRTYLEGVKMLRSRENPAKTRDMKRQSWQSLISWEFHREKSKDWAIQRLKKNGETTKIWGFHQSGLNQTLKTWGLINNK